MEIGKVYTNNKQKETRFVLKTNYSNKKILLLQSIKEMNTASNISNQLTEIKNHPSFKAGDNITVFYKIKEGNKERIQFFKGDVLQLRGTSSTRTFTIRKVSNNVGVERIFPLNSPMIEKIEVNKIGKVRRARIFYLRKLTGKKARIKEVKK